MGLDVYGVFFYGMPVSHEKVKELKQRDEARKIWVCRTCKKQINSEFCPHDGGKGYQPEILPGFEDFRDYKTDDVETENVDYWSSNGWYLYYHRETTDSNRMDLAPTPVGKNPADDIDFEIADAAIKKACEHLGLPYKEPQFYVSMSLSY